jgi:hypothetical protein
VFHGHHVRDVSRQDHGQLIEVMPPVIAVADDAMEMHTVLWTRRPAPGFSRDPIRHSYSAFTRLGRASH